MSAKLGSEPPMSEAQSLVQKNIRAICDDFDRDYWRQKSVNHEYPHEFVDELVDGGWLGVAIPPEYGGEGFGTPEVTVMMEEIAAGGAGFSGAQAIHGAIYNSVPIVNYGSERRKEELLPKVASGDVSIQAFCLTEPNAGSDSTSIETTAEKDGDEWVIEGQKIWTSRVDVSDYAVVIARTTPIDEVDKPTRGISMFLVDIEDAVSAGTLEYEKIPKSASDMVNSFEMWFDGVRIPEDALIGEQGNGFYQVLDGLNEERTVVAAEAIGLGELAIERGVEYADNREVFGRSIGKNQAIQHPLAAAHARLEGAKALTYQTADQVEGGDQRAVGARANMAKYLAAEACYEAADAAVQTHGGFGIATEYDVERYFREARLTKLVPITQELVLNYVGEQVLGLPKSY